MKNLWPHKKIYGINRGEKKAIEIYQKILLNNISLIKNRIE